MHNNKNHKELVVDKIKKRSTSSFQSESEES